MRLVMGILNVTPDSFYDGGAYLDTDAAVERGLEMLEEGADIIDVGGESTRPGAMPVSEAKEISRVVPVVEKLAGRVTVSIDTRKAAVAQRAIEAGATIINDVSASLYPIAADLGVAWVAMHMKGEPRTMQQAPEYADVVREVDDFLCERARLAEAAGVGEVWVDPGIGFGKTFDHNLELLRAIPTLVSHGRPVVIGVSRKSFLGRISAPTSMDDLSPGERLDGSIATAIWALMSGASVVRVHDVRATKQALGLIEACASTGSPLQAQM